MLGSMDGGKDGRLKNTEMLDDLGVHSFVQRTIWIQVFQFIPNCVVKKKVINLKYNNERC